MLSEVILNCIEESEMFSADDIQARVRKQPFVPLRLVLTTGQSYDVRHPDLIMVGRRDLMLGLPSAENPTQYDQVTRVALLHVVELQDLPAGASKTTNGAS
jgi:hypothetical protein